MMHSIVSLASGTHSVIPGFAPLNMLPLLRPDGGDEDLDGDLEDEDLDEDEEDLDDEDLDEDEEDLDEVDDVN